MIKNIYNRQTNNFHKNNIIVKNMHFGLITELGKYFLDCLACKIYEEN